MIKHVKVTITFLTCATVGLLSSGIHHSASAEQMKMANAQQAKPGLMSGKVTEVIDASNYTYAEVEVGNKKVWAAGPITPLKVGDTVSFTTGMLMENFRSKSMQRDFAIIYFVGRFITGNEHSAANAMQTTAPHAQYKKKPAPKPEPVLGINKIKNGHSIAEIYNQKNKLNGKTIRVRGLITKFTPEIMGKNWIHIRDSSTLADLTVTTNNTAAISDVVIIEGKLELDKDYSYGYIYPVILENGSVTKE